MILTATGSGRFRIAPGDLLDGRRYGLLAPWRGHGGQRPPPIVAAPFAEITTTPVLRRATRVLIAADGFYARAKVGARTHAWWVHGARWLAGLAATHKDDGVDAFAIVTVPAKLAHVALAAAAADETWIAEGAVLAPWQLVEVTRRFETHDDAACIAPLGNPAQGSLF